MSSKPLVSVVIIFLNAELYIEEAVQSVLAQTYDNWELLLVDDGSTDGSAQIALRYAERYPEKVRYLEHARHRNRGMSASRNLGIRDSRGQYIAFLDADDLWLPYKLEQQVAIMDSYPEASMVYGSTQFWYSWTGEPQDVQRDYVAELGVQTNTLYRPPTLLTLLYPLQHVFGPSSSNLLLRRQAVERVGGFEEAFKGIYEDQAFLVKVYLHEPVFVASECWDRYRQHSNSCSAIVVNTGKYQSVRFFFLNWLVEYLSQQGVDDSEVWKLLREKRLITQARVHAQEGKWVRASRDMLLLLRYYPRAVVHACWKRIARACSSLLRVVPVGPKATASGAKEQDKYLSHDT